MFATYSTNLIKHGRKLQSVSSRHFHEGMPSIVSEDALRHYVSILASIDYMEQTLFGLAGL